MTNNSQYISRFFKENFKDKWFKRLQRKYFFICLFPIRFFQRKKAIENEIIRRLKNYLLEKSGTDYLDPFHFEILLKKYFTYKPHKFLLYGFSIILGVSVTVGIAVPMVQKLDLHQIKTDFNQLLTDVQAQINKLPKNDQGKFLSKLEQIKDLVSKQNNYQTYRTAYNQLEAFQKSIIQ
ncbi:hypothetical protein OF375_02065 [Ureaplasma miroungigenitalium]|nr:hypothetical protein [Ureaplasma miroungigenitalium]